MYEEIFNQIRSAANKRNLKDSTIHAYCTSCLLYTSIESWIDMEGNPYFYGLSSHENVEIKLYNKANPLKPWKMMGRMPVSYTHL